MLLGFGRAVAADSRLETFLIDRNRGPQHITICGGRDNEDGGAGNDQLNGGPGVDVLHGDDGADTLTATDGIADGIVDGGAGNDTIRKDRVDPGTGT